MKKIPQAGGGDIRWPENILRNYKLWATKSHENRLCNKLQNCQRHLAASDVNFKPQKIINSNLTSRSNFPTIFTISIDI